MKTNHERTPDGFLDVDRTIRAAENAINMEEGRKILTGEIARISALKARSRLRELFPDPNHGSEWNDESLGFLLLEGQATKQSMVEMVEEALETLAERLKLFEEALPGLSSSIEEPDVGHFVLAPIQWTGEKMDLVKLADAIAPFLNVTRTAFLAHFLDRHGKPFDRSESDLLTKAKSPQFSDQLTVALRGRI
ncbi:MAG: hypothetical protein WCG80_02045 [Spirochaetales bacterium]